MNRRSPLIVAAALLAGIGLTTPADPAAALSPGRTEVVSTGSAGAEPAGAASSPAISADGSQVAFESRAILDPVVRPSTDPAYNIYVRDRRRPGHTVLISRGLPMTYLASGGFSVPLRATAAPEVGGDGDSLHASISASGRYVAFDSTAANLRDGFGRAVRRVVICDRDPDNDGVFDELRPDRTMDYAYVYLGAPPVGNDVTSGSDPSLSADGRAVAWREQLPDASTARIAAAPIVLDPQGRPLAPDPSTFEHPEADGSAGPPQLSADGTQLVFVAGQCPAFAPKLGCSDPYGPVELFDLRTNRTTRVSYLPDGSFTNSAQHPVISGSGRLVAYETYYDGSVVTVVVDRDPAGTGHLGPGPDTPVTAVVGSRDSAGRPAEGRMPSLSTDGRYLAFVSAAGGMYDDAEGPDRPAVVLRDLVLDASREKAGLPRVPGELGSPSAEQCGKQTCPATGPNESPRLSADGAVVVFTSAGADLVSPACCAGAVFARVFQPSVTSAAGTFGTVPVGGSESRTIVVHHSGFGPVTIGSTHVEGDAAFGVDGAENCVGATLHGGETCSISVAFRPLSPGAKHAVLHIGQGDGTVVDVPLSGTADSDPSTPPVPPSGPEPAGGLVITPETVNFGGNGPALAPIGSRIVQVRNGATIPVTVSSAGILDGPRFVPGDFTVAASTCVGRRLAPGDTCTIEVRATPQLPGARNGVLAITAADPAYTRLIVLSARAAPPALTPNPAVVRPNRVTTVVGTNFPPSRTVTITLATPGGRSVTVTTATSDGRLSTALLVFPQISAGSWPVTATVDGTAIRGKTTVLVVPGSFQPPDFTSRR